MRCRHCLPRSAALLLLCLPLFAKADGNWPQWRGPEGDGHCREAGVPVHWDARSVVWKTPLPGSGQSSPVLWGDRIFLTAALEQGRKRLVLAVDRHRGTILWQRQAWSGEPESIHGMNGWASATCATDGERVVAFFGKGGLHCYSVDGKPLWSRDLGPFLGPWGTAACPILLGDLVIQNCDAVQEASLVALDKRTGKTVWQTPRRAPDRGGWSTPVLVRVGARAELVLNGERAVTAYDPATGRPLWWCKSFAGRGDPTVAPGNGLVHVVNGQPGDIYAVRPGGKGDVTRSHLAWHMPRRGGRDLPSPIVVGIFLVVANMAGITTCYEAATGKELWKVRLHGPFSASPIAAGGLVYFQSESGKTSVIEPGPTFKLVAENVLPSARGSRFRASLAASRGQLFSRSHTHLYCIGKKEQPASPAE